MTRLRYKLRILWALLVKEVLLIRSNPLAPKVIFMMPLAVMLVMPLVASFDVKNVGVAVVDTSHSPLSRRIVADMSASQWLRVDTVVATYPQAMESLEHGGADVILSLPPALDRQPELIDIAANSVNATKGVLGAQYVAQSVSMTLKRWQSRQGAVAATPSTQLQVSTPQQDASVINMYNPTLNYKFYMIPALVGVLIIVICGFLPALNIVSEKETGTIEAMNVTPVGKVSFVLSKLIPYWVIGLIVTVIGLTIGRLVYGLEPAGSLGAILLGTFLFSLVMSGIGVTVANSSQTMMQSILVMYALIMVFQLMGGLFTPVGSMPEWAQRITYAIPTRYYIDIMRAVCLKGSTVAHLSFEFLALAAIAAAVSLLAAITYRKQT